MKLKSLIVVVMLLSSSFVFAQDDVTELQQRLQKPIIPYQTPLEQLLQSPLLGVGIEVLMSSLTNEDHSDPNDSMLNKASRSTKIQFQK